MLTGKELGDAIASAMKKKGVSPTELARIFDVRSPSVHGWMKSGRIGKDKLPDLLLYFSDVVKPGHWGLSESNERFMTSQGPMEQDGIAPGPDITARVPLISSTTAGQWSEVVDNLQPGDAEDWIVTTARVGPHAYALRIQGDSMEPIIPDGAIVVVDPDASADHNRVVIVRQNGHSEATCKRLIYDGGKPYLRPDNPRYPIIEMAPDAVICGVVRQVVVDLD